MTTVLNCSKCCSANRTIAKYCKRCGTALIHSNISSTALETRADFSGLVGRKEVKDDFEKILKIAQSMKKMGKSSGSQRLHTIFMGSTGTGKTMIVHILAKAFHEAGITVKKDPKIIEASEFAQFAKDLSNNYKAAKGGILFIDNVQKLVPAEYTAGQITEIDKLVTEMEKNGNDPIVVIAGLTEGFRTFIDTNPDVKSKFRFFHKLQDFSSTEMVEIALNRFLNKKFKLDAAAEEKIRKVLRHLWKMKDISFGNGHVVNDLVDEIIDNFHIRCDGNLQANIIIADDIKRDIPEEKTAEQILSELDSFVGMDNIKSYIRNVIDRVSVSKADAEKSGQGYCFGEHMIITGSPGTGKTTLARKLGEIFAAAGLLDRGHVIEVDRSKLIASYVGQTAKLVQQYCDKALGGILFIDEAYTLKQFDRDTFGQEAIDTLLKRMEDDRGRFMVIAAGYSNEMQKFINANPGLKSRFKESNIFNIDDYIPEQLIKIFGLIAKAEGFYIENEANAPIKKSVEYMYATRDEKFGNGRDIRNFFEDCKAMRATRIAAGSEHDMVIRSIDIPSLEPSDDSKENPLEELDKLIGLKAVKSAIKDLISYLEVEKMRTGIKSGASISSHFVFRGNPGTGKTTVARILGQIFKNIGLLPKGHVVEVKREDLIAEFVGQTAIKTDKKLESAIGGILFIDEAYTLVSGGANDFGQEAINTLLTRMENDRGKIVVIVAGYNNEMDAFLASNTGLSSRFTGFIDFEDYSPSELKDIFMKFCDSRQMKPVTGFEEEIFSIFEEIYAKRDKFFANGRTVRNLFEKTMVRHSTRIMEMKNKGLDLTNALHTLTLEDISRGVK